MSESEQQDNLDKANDEELAELGHELMNAIGRNEGILKEDQDIDDVEEADEMIGLVQLIQDSLVYADINDVQEDGEYELEYELDYPEHIREGIEAYEAIGSISAEEATRLYYQFGPFDELDSAPATDEMNDLIGIDDERAEKLLSVLSDELA